MKPDFAYQHENYVEIGNQKSSVGVEKFENVAKEIIFKFFDQKNTYKNLYYKPENHYFNAKLLENKLFTSTA